MLPEAATMSATTEQPAPHKGGFPPFKTESFPSQIFWLVITFAFLFVVLWRVAGPRIAGVIGARRDKINGDISSAEQSRKDAEAASDAYDAALAAARARANALADENRKVVSAEFERAKAAADAEAHTAMSAADARIATLRANAKAQVTKVAQDAAAEIVRHLTGDNVPADDAAAAVRATGGG